MLRTARPSPGKCFTTAATLASASPRANAVTARVINGLGDRKRAPLRREERARCRHVGDRSEIDGDTPARAPALRAAPRAGFARRSNGRAPPPSARAPPTRRAAPPLPPGLPRSAAAGAPQSVPRAAAPRQALQLRPAPDIGTKENDAADLAAADAGEQSGRRPDPVQRDHEALPDELTDRRRARSDHHGECGRRTTRAGPGATSWHESARQRRSMRFRAVAAREPADARRRPGPSRRRRRGRMRTRQDLQDCRRQHRPDLPRGGTPAQTVFYTDAVQTGCGAGVVGPYCPVDKRVYIDLGFFDELPLPCGARREDTRGRAVVLPATR